MLWLQATIIPSNAHVIKGKLTRPVRYRKLKRLNPQEVSINEVIDTLKIKKVTKIGKLCWLYARILFEVTTHSIFTSLYDFL